MGKLKNIFKKRFDGYNSTFSQVMKISEMVKPDLFFCDTLNNESCFDVAWLKNKPFVGIATSVLGKLFFFFFFCYSFYFNKNT
jgi:hypothetical protein